MLLKILASKNSFFLEIEKKNEYSYHSYILNVLCTNILQNKDPVKYIFF